MSSIKTIRLKTESAGNTKAGNPYKRYEFQFEDGSKISSFDDRIGNNFQIGQTVLIETVQKGNFQELKSMQLAPAGTAPQVPTENFKSNARENSIIAQTLTKCLAEYMAANPKAENLNEVRAILLESYKFFNSNL